MPPKGTTRSDCVPSEPIVQALRDYLTECDSGEHHTGVNTGNGERRYSGPFEAVAEKIGVQPDSVWRTTYSPYKTMQFDKADRILAAIHQTFLWYCDPVLAEVYERAVLAADRFKPITGLPEAA